MPSYILFRVRDAWGANDPMVQDTGYPIHARYKNQIGGPQSPPDFVQVEITDDDAWESLQDIYCRLWRRAIDWEFLGHDYEIDGHRLKVFMKPELVSVSNLNSLTRDQVEGFLNGWGASIVSVAVNEVAFDCTILNAIKSQSFWNYDTSLIMFTEIEYDSSLGVHRIEANYAASPLNQLEPQKIEERIVFRGGTIVRHPTNKVIFDINRSSVFSVFKQHVANEIDGDHFSRRMFTLLPQHVQIAIDNGGTLSVTRQQFANYIHNRLND